MSARKQASRRTCSSEPRGLRHDWRLWRYKFITGLISRYELCIYTILCAVLYAEYLQDAVPKGIAEFLLVMLIAPVFSKRYSDTIRIIPSVLRKLLETLAMSLSEIDDSER